MAAGPGGPEVGRVSVRVVPDTARFRRELEQQLRRAFAGLDPVVDIDGSAVRRVSKDLDDIDGRRVTPEVDSSSIDRARRSTRGVSEEARRAAREFALFREEIKDIGSEIQAVNRRMVELGRDSKTVTHGPEFWRFIRNVDQLRDRLAGVREGFGEARQGADRFRDSITRVQEMQLDRTLRKLDDDLRRTGKAWDPFIDGARRAIDRNEQLRLRSGVTFRAMRLGMSGLTSTFGAMSKGFGAVLSVIFDSMGQLGNAFTKAKGNAVAMVATFLGMATAVSAIVAPIIGVVSSLIVALPSLVSVMGVTASAIILGWEGIKKAAEALGPPIDDLKAKLSERFQDNLTPIFDRLAEQIPMMESGMLRVADSISGIVDSVVSVVTSFEGWAMIDTIINNTATLLTGLRGYIENVLTGFLLLAAVASESFGHLQASFQTFGENFLEMSKRIASDGSLAAAMEGLRHTLDGIGIAFLVVLEAGVRAFGEQGLGKELGSFIAKLGEFVAAVLPAMTIAAEAFFRLAQVGMVVFGGLVQQMQPFIDIMDKLSGVVEGVLGKVGEFIGNLDQLGTSASSMPGIMGSAMPPAARSVSEFADSASSDVDRANESFGRLGSGMDANRQALATSLSGMGQDMARLPLDAGTAADGTNAAFQSLPIEIGSITASLREMFPGMFDSLPTEAQNAASLTKLPFQGMPGEIGTSLAGLAPVATTAFNPLPLIAGMQANAVVTTFAMMPGRIATALAGLPESMRIAFDPLPLAAQQAVDSTLLKFNALPGGITTAMAGVGVAFLEMPRQADLAVQQTINSFNQVPVAVHSAMTVAGTALQILPTQTNVAVNAAIAAINRFPPAVGSGMARASGHVAVGCANMVSTAQGFSGRFYSAGYALMSSFAAGINAGSPLVAGAVQRAVANATANLPSSPAKVGPLSGRGWTLYRGRAMVQGFVDGINSEARKASLAAHSMMQDVSAAFRKHTNGTDLCDFDLASQIRDATPAAVAAAEQVSAVVASTARQELHAFIESDSFRGLKGEILDALTGWTIEMDRNGLARIVNKSNIARSRRQ